MSHGIAVSTIPVEVIAERVVRRFIFCMMFSFKSVLWLLVLIRYSERGEQTRILLYMERSRYSEQSKLKDYWSLYNLVAISRWLCTYINLCCYQTVHRHVKDEPIQHRLVKDLEVVRKSVSGQKTKNNSLVRIFGRVLDCLDNLFLNESPFEKYKNCGVRPKK